MATVALFAIGFAASDEEESSNSSNESSKPQTEQKQETEAERQAREQKETEKKKKELEKEAYNEGYDEGYKATSAMYATLNPENIARNNYVTWNGAPKTPKEKELCNIYIENYVKGWEEGHNAQ